MGGGACFGENLIHNMGAFLGKHSTLNMGAFLGKNLTHNAPVECIFTVGVVFTVGLYTCSSYENERPVVCLKLCFEKIAILDRVTFA